MSDLSIHVLNNREEPLRGIKVGLEYISRVLDGNRFVDVCEGWGGEARTDEDGYAHFNDFKGGLIVVYLNGKFAGRNHINRGDITFNMGGREKYDDGQSGYHMRSG